MARIRVVVRFTFEGVHSWPDAPDYKQEFYLRYPHRHVFHVEAVKAVEHEERDIEIIDLKHRLQDYCNHQFKGPHSWSCETMALELLTGFDLVRCRVLEDAENGAEVEA